MIELAYLLFIVPKTIGELARERGASTLRWSLAGIGAWLGTELVLILVCLGAIDWVRSGLGWQGDLGPAILLLYFGPLAAGAYAYELVKRRLEARPKVPSPVGPPGGAILPKNR